MSRVDLSVARDLARFIDASPSPFHAAREAARMLEGAGFSGVDERASWSSAPGRFYMVRGGALVAWVVGEDAGPATGFRVVGAHTDSPNLRIKPRPDRLQSGCWQLGVEVYGGVLLNSWLDRDLGLSGRVWVRGAGAPGAKGASGAGSAGDGAGAGSHGGEPIERLFRVDRPVLRVPQLAIHLHREIHTEGLLLNRQLHVTPIFGLAEASDIGFRGWLAGEVGVEPSDVLAWDAMCHDVQPAAIAGAGEEFVSAARLDNLCSSFVALRALVECAGRGEVPRHVPVVCLFDHEEVGSATSRGAQSPLLRDVLERTVLARGGGREELHRALARSACVSADMAHATHPNYPDKHEPEHTIAMNAGPVIKINANQRYASEGETEALFQLACEAAEVPFQKFVSRTDLACGSTIGPLTAANLGMRTVDVGCSQLAMHSAREICGSHDPGFLVRALGQFFA